MVRTERGIAVSVWGTFGGESQTNCGGCGGVCGGRGNKYTHFLFVCLDRAQARKNNVVGGSSGD